MVLTKNQTKAAKAKIRNHYNLDRPITDQEMWGEIKSLQHKSIKLNLDDRDELLFNVLSSGNHEISL